MAGYVSSAGGYEDISADKKLYLNYEPEILYRYKLTFSQSGTVDFSVATLTSNTGVPEDVRVWFGTEPGYVSGTVITPEGWDYYEVSTDHYFDFVIDSSETYYLWIQSYNSAVGGEAEIAIFPKFATERPEDFSFSDSFASGSAAVTINKQGDEITISFNHWEEWNKFVERVEDFLKYKGCFNGPDADTYQAYIDNAKLDEGDNLTATQFNEIRFCIGSMNGFSNYPDTDIYKHYTETGRWDMSSDDKMKAAYYNDLAQVLNDIE